MVINTIKHNYYVIHKLLENKELETFLCYEAGSTEAQGSLTMDKNPQNRYRVTRLKDKELAKKMIPFFMELMKHTTFTDYYECFSKDSHLHLVFKHNDYQTLIHKLDHERCELRERIEIGKKLLEHILMLDMPDFILFDALSEDNVTVSSTLEVLFNYNLLSMQHQGTLGVPEVKQRLVFLFKHLFEYELVREASVDIEDFILELAKEEYSNYFEIFRKYEVLYEKLMTGDLIKKMKPNTFIFRLWDRIKGLGKYVKPALSIIIVILIAGYLIYSIMHKTVDAALVLNFDQIGTVAVEGSTETVEGGADTIEGGAVAVEGGTDTVEGGTDTVEGGTDTVEGGTDTVEGGADTIEGGADTVEVGAGK